MSSIPPPPSTAATGNPGAAAPRRRPYRVAAAVAILATASLFVWKRQTKAASAPDSPSRPPTVLAATVTREDLFKELTIQAEFRPYQEVELHSKVAGYLRQIDVDFGDQVKSGQLIATLEVPELRDDLAGALAAEQRAEADYRDAHLDYTRLVAVGKSQPNLIAQQDIDAAEAKDGIATANLAAARAQARKYRTLVDYTQITAPFSGVVTQRYADPGALIQAGTASNTQSQPLIRLSENDRLRLDFPVSVSYVNEIAVGDPVEIRLDTSNRNLTGTIARSTQRIAMDTRTMETEVDVPNRDLKLIPGMYATATIRVQRRPHALAVPVEAVSGGQEPTVCVIGRDDRVEERRVKLGIETATRYEVLSGLSEGDRVIIGNRAGVRPGQAVDIKLVQLATIP